MISHRNSAYMDCAEVERAAGMLEQKARSRPCDGRAAMYMGAAFALRVLQDYDVKAAEDFMTILTRHFEELETNWPTLF